MVWKRTWGYLQQDYRSWPSLVNNEIQLIRIRSNHISNQMKIHFSNKYGIVPICFKRIQIRLLDQDLNILETSEITKKMTIEPGATLDSDEIFLDIHPDDIIEILTFLDKPTMITSGIVSYSRLEQEVLNYKDVYNYLQTPFDQRKIFEMVKQNDRMFFIYGVSGILMDVKKGSKTIVAFGDSLTHQGFWTDALQKSIRESGYHNVSVLNQGIGGSQILLGTSSQYDEFLRHGIAGVDRFEADIFDGINKPDVVIVQHGINDVITSQDNNAEIRFTTEDIIAGLQIYESQSRKHQCEIYCVTLTPMGNSPMYNSNIENERQAINEWIRTQKEYSGIIDFDQVLKDESRSIYLKEEFDCGDGLHYSAQGGRVAAEAVMGNRKFVSIFEDKETEENDSRVI